MKVVKIKTEELIPYARNARTHSDEQIDQIAASIKQFGWTNPILVKPDNTVVAGHGRLTAAQKIGMDAVPCIILENLSDEQCRALVIADNKLALNAGWDDDLLASELAELSVLDFDLSAVGFSDDELQKLLDGLTYSEKTDFDLPDGDKKPFEQITFTLAKKQADLIRKAIKSIPNPPVAFGNENKNSNAIYEVVRQWAEQRK
jgi:ParB/RepB/Spo0J family partition protein